MKSSTRLDSSIFQLTPTRTRCDLFIVANEKKEKIASGLLQPFIVHLKTAEDQIAKGGYSILLKPVGGSDATWFTKGTMERFVRFVSTPEILERVYTIECEILQIEESIAIQGSNDIGLSSIENHQLQQAGSRQSDKSLPAPVPLPDSNEEKAIVLYKPDEYSPETSITKGENSKMQLLNVLDVRKTVLQKEQGMAFACAVAAGFDIDRLAPLVCFAECFGASRLKNACTRFVDLWKKRHETGQWLEIEAAEAKSIKSDFSAMNASGIILSSMDNNNHESHNELNPETKGKADERLSMDCQIPLGQPEYIQGQCPPPMFSPWPMHSPQGAMPIFQPYPVQGIPYYQNYAGSGPYYQPPYPPMDDSQSSLGPRTGQKRQSMGGRDSSTESEVWDTHASNIRRQDDSELEKEGSQGQERRKKSGKKKSGMVVIRNINYITSKRLNTSGTESDSASGSETDKETGDFLVDAADNGITSSSSNRKVRKTKTYEEKLLHNEGDPNGKDLDGGHWQAFQNCLLRGADEDSRASNDSLFAMEHHNEVKRRQNAGGDDPTLTGPDLVETQVRRADFLDINGNVSRRLRATTDEDLIIRESAYSNAIRTPLNGEDIQSTESNGRKLYRRAMKDDLIIGSRVHQSDLEYSSHPLAVNGFECSKNSLHNSLPVMNDESFIVPFRSMSLDQVGVDDRTAVKMGSELLSGTHQTETTSNGMGSQVYYEPNDLSLMPERGVEKRSMGYDPALDYEMQVSLEAVATLDKTNQQAATDVSQASKRTDRDRKSKVTPDSLDKKKIGGPIRKEKPTKMSRLDDARARAEKLRTYKADLQKMKKEKEEAELKRLDALKMERQKRIAARGSSVSARSPLPPHQTKKPLPTKLSPISYRASKFTDGDPGSLSPLQRSKIKASLGSSATQKASKANRSSDGSHIVGNKLSRSMSSLSDTKKETSGIMPDLKASMARIRRLSEPKMMSSHSATSLKTRSIEPAKPKASDGPESKKISAIINLDKRKAATLPEIKIRTSKASSHAAHGKSEAKEMTLKKNEGKPSITSEIARVNVDIDNILLQSDVDDNPVIEKTVVMLECEKPSVPLMHQSQEKLDAQGGHNDNHEMGGKREAISEYAAAFAPPSPVDAVDIEAILIQSHDQPSPYGVPTQFSKEDMPEIVSIAAEKPYQAPCARVSSLEDPCTGNSQYVRAPPTSLEMLSTSADAARVHTSNCNNLQLEKVPEILEKPRVKESSKGLRRLLKFARKNHISSTAEHGLESDGGGVVGSEADDNATNNAKSEAHKLKNLISEDEAPHAANALQKSSRQFSLFSPFRSKTTEKKVIV